jgi:hypothetical protein
MVEKVAQAIRTAQEAGWDENPLYGCARAALSVIEAPDYPAATRSLVAAVKAQVKAERERDEARAALDRVRALHKRIAESPLVVWCEEDGFSWPCPTIRAIDGVPS